MQLLLLLMILFRRVDLECFDDNIILFRFCNFKYLMYFIFMSELVFKLLFTQLTVKSFPGVWGDEWTNLLVFISAKPLPKTLKMNMFHGTRTLTWWNERIFFVNVIWKANPTHVTFRGLTNQIIVFLLSNLCSDDIIFNLLLFFAQITNSQPFNRSLLTWLVSDFIISIKINKIWTDF